MATNKNRNRVDDRIETTSSRTLNVHTCTDGRTDELFEKTTLYHSDENGKRVLFARRGNRHAARARALTRLRLRKVFIVRRTIDTRDLGSLSVSLYTRYNFVIAYRDARR